MLECSAAFLALRCSFGSTGPEYGGLVGVALCGRNLLSFHPSWAVAGGGVGVFSPLSGRGSEADLVMVTCTQSWFRGVLGVELFSGEAGIVEVFLWLLGFIMFRRVTSPLGSVLAFVTVEAGVHNLFEFIFRFSVYLNRRRRPLNL